MTSAMLSDSSNLRTLMAYSMDLPRPRFSQFKIELDAQLVIILSMSIVGIHSLVKHSLEGNDTEG